MADPVIVVEGLEKTYRDGTQAVRGVTFNVERGEIFGFLGPNGAGKTTTMRILGTLHEATKGKATILGFDVQKQAKQIKERIGFAMQEVGMDDLATGEEMLILHAKLYGASNAEAKRRAAELLQTFGLTEHAKRRVTRFSGGMQRRLDLAVSLIHTPELLFLDEPSTGLDPTSRSELWGILRKLRSESKITIFMSTHYMEEADVLCDRIAIMYNGKIAAIDTPQNLKRSVGADRVRVRVQTPPTPDQRAAVEQVFRGANVRFIGDAVEIRVVDGARALMPALNELARCGLLVLETQVLKPTLDDVFLKYTGARMEEAEQKPADGEAKGGPRGRKPTEGPVQFRERETFEVKA